MSRPERVEEVIDRLRYASLADPRGMNPSGALRTESFRDFLSGASTDPRWLVEDLIPSEGLVLLAGEPKSYKTMLMSQMAICVASQATSFLGRQTEHGPVVTVFEEGTRASMQERLRRQADGLGIAGEPSMDLKIVFRQGIHLDAGGTASIASTVEELHPRLVTLDPFAFMHRRDENNAGEMAGLMHDLGTIANEHRCAIVLVHHVSKPLANGNRPRLPARARGSSALEAAADAIVVVERRGGGLHVRGIYRDGEPAALDLAFDADELLLYESDAAAAQPKISLDKLRIFVEREGEVSAKDVMDRFGVAKNTARAALGTGVREGWLTLDIRERRTEYYRLTDQEGHTGH